MFRFALPAAALLAVPALAQEAPPKDFTVSGSVAVVNDYRFRGVSQSDKGFAVQGGLGVTHKSGLYAGTWGSNLAGWGTFGGANLELDLYGGYKHTFGNLTVDVGLTWYMYPQGADDTDFAEPYIKVSGTAGPASVLVGVAYAPPQQALGRWYFTGADAVAGVYNRPGDKEDNTYIWTDVSGAVPGTPVTAKAHVGYSWGNKGLGPNGTSVAPTGKYLDYLVGVDIAFAPVTLGFAFVDTDIGKNERLYLTPNFGTVKNAKSISSGRFVVSLGASF